MNLRELIAHQFDAWSVIPVPMAALRYWREET